MRIGILTFHRAHNCGAMLQCFALQTVLERMGHTVDVLDCNDIGEEKRFRNLCLWPLRRSARKVIEFLFSLGSFDLRLLRFAKFRRCNLHLSEPVDFRNFPQKYDRYIVGSDQVFQPNLTKELAPLFLLDAVLDDTKKFSYAASFGYESLPEKFRPLYRRCLDKFSALSVREASGVKIVQEELGLKKNVSVVLDPTLLLTAADYASIEKRNTSPEKYVLVYSIGGAYKKLRDTARQVAKKFGLEIVYVNACRRHYWDVPFSDYLSISPDRLIYLIHHAQFVVTTSFHGVAFSLIYHRPFVAILPNDSKVSGRIPALLSAIALSDNAISEDESVSDSLIDSAKKMDYVAIDAKLDLLRRKSFAFLESV